MRALAGAGLAVVAGGAANLRASSDRTQAIRAHARLLGRGLCYRRVADPVEKGRSQGLRANFDRTHCSFQAARNVELRRTARPLHNGAQAAASDLFRMIRTLAARAGVSCLVGPHFYGG